MLKVPGNVGKVRHSCQLHDRAFVSPQWPGVNETRRDEEQDNERKKNRDDAFDSSQPIESRR
jgi:hypothetical protein